MRRAAAADELAWRQLIDGLGPLLRRVSSAYRLGEAEAADAVGDRVQTGAAAISDPSGAMLEMYGITSRAAVLVRADGHTCTVLPGADLHCELIDALTEFTTTGFATKEELQR